MLSSRGYTLAELLLAMFLLSLVVASVYGAYKAAFTVIRGSEQQALHADRGGFVLSRMSDDLLSLILGKGGFLLGEELSFAGGRRDSLSFLSSAQVVLGKTDIPRGRLLISYFVEVDDLSQLLTLYRAETVILPGVKTGEGGTQKHLLCSGLKEISFTYRDAMGNILTTWKSDGEDTDKGGKVPNIPVMVGVEMVFPGTAPGEKVQLLRTNIALPQQGES